MSSEVIPFCQICQTTFPTHEDLTVHSCDPEIKQENQDSKPEKDAGVHILQKK